MYSRSIQHHNSVFERVIVLPELRGGSTITWWLDTRKFKTPGPYQFYVEWAEHPDADFEEVAGPTAGNTLVDETQRRYSKLPHSVYRVRINTPSGDYYSEANLCLGNWNRHDYLIARDIIRREYKLLTRYTGTLGYYLARKQWGETCACADWNTDMPSNAHCRLCYGTGLVGGYHPASELLVQEDRTGVRAERQDGIGMRTDQVQLVRAVACPFLTAKDIWVHPGTGERWSIERKKEVVALRGQPLVYDVELRLIELGNIAYDIQLVERGSSSSET